MDYGDRIEIHVGFLNGDDVWFEHELLKSGKVVFDPSEHKPRHLVLAGSEHMRSLAFNYVRCSIPVRCLISSACAGLEGEAINSVTFYSIARPSVREIFKRNCKKAALEDTTMMVPPDVDETLDTLLSMKGVHIMQETSMKMGGTMAISYTKMFDSAEQFCERVKNELKSGKQVFLYSVLQQIDGQVKPEHLNWWRWVVLPEED